MPHVETRAIRLSVSAPITVTNRGSGTLYYSDSQAVSSSVNEGNVTSGNSVTFFASKWVVADTRVEIDVTDASGGIGSSTPTGGRPGDIRVGSGKIWANDQGVWRSATIT